MGQSNSHEYTSVKTKHDENQPKNAGTQQKESVSQPKNGGSHAIKKNKQVPPNQETFKPREAGDKKKAGAVESFYATRPSSEQRVMAPFASRFYF
jgi:hypothetical protein